MQRIEPQAVIRGFGTVFCYMAESEAEVESIAVRHPNQQQAAWIRWNT